MIVMFSDYPLKWMRRRSKPEGEHKILADALATAWEKRRKPKGDALEQQWNALCLDAVFIMRNQNVSVSYEIFPDDEMQLGAFSINDFRLSSWDD